MRPASFILGRRVLPGGSGTPSWIGPCPNKNCGKTVKGVIAVVAVTQTEGTHIAFILPGHRPGAELIYDRLLPLDESGQLPQVPGEAIGHCIYEVTDQYVSEADRRLVRRCFYGGDDVSEETGEDRVDHLNDEVLRQHQSGSSRSRYVTIGGDAGVAEPLGPNDSVIARPK